MDYESIQLICHHQTVPDYPLINKYSLDQLLELVVIYLEYHYPQLPLIAFGNR